MKSDSRSRDLNPCDENKERSEKQEMKSCLEDFATFVKKKAIPKYIRCNTLLLLLMETTMLECDSFDTTLRRSRLSV